MKNQTQNKKNDEESKKSKLILILITFIIILIVILKGCNFTNGIIETTGIEYGDISPIGRNGVENRQDEINSLVDESMFSTFLNKNIYVDSDNIADILVKNDKNNVYDCYVEYSLDDDIILKTDVIPPGYKIEKIAFDKTLTSGIYNAMATFNILEKNEVVNSVRIPVQITKK